MARDADRKLMLDELVERFRFITADDDNARDAALAEMDVHSRRATTP